MNEYAHIDPARRIHSAPGLIDRAGELLDQMGRQRALIVVGAVMAASPLFTRLKTALGARVAGVLSGVTPHSGPDWVREGLRLRTAHQADAIISLGGGSTIDTAKCIALNAMLGGDIADLRIKPPHAASLNAQVPFDPVLPHLCIPTTGSGSEVTPGAGLRAPDGSKWIYWHVSMSPQVVLLDAAAAATTPVGIAAESSLNSLAHAVEALYAVNRQTLTDAYALGSMRLFAKFLPRLRSAPDDLEVRGEIQQAWLLAGLSISNARVALHHAMCHCLGARFDVSHGAANSIMLPHVMRFNLPVARAQLALAGHALGASGDEQSLAEGAISAVERLQQQLAVPTRLRDVKVPLDGLDALTTDAMHERAAQFNPRKVVHDEVLELFRAAW